LSFLTWFESQLHRLRIVPRSLGVMGVGKNRGQNQMIYGGVPHPGPVLSGSGFFGEVHLKLQQARQRVRPLTGVAISMPQLDALQIAAESIEIRVVVGLDCPSVDCCKLRHNDVFRYDSQRGLRILRAHQIITKSKPKRLITPCIRRVSKSASNLHFLGFAWKRKYCFSKEVQGWSTEDR